MSKKRPLFLRVFFPAAALFFLAGCPVPDSQKDGGVSQDGGEVLEFRTFFTQRTDTKTPEFYTVNAAKLAEGSRCIVFADVKEESISAKIAASIAAEYDTNIYPKITEAFGDYMAAGFDVDGNGKTILFLVDIQDGYTGGSGGYVAGYFDTTHMEISSYSNRADMLFIDVNPQVPGSVGFYVNIAHELQHLINYSLHGGAPQELWLNEGLSSAAEYLYSGHRQDRIGYFNSDPLQTIAYGNNFFVWNGDWERKYGDVLANYATAYLFFQWLRIHGGNSIYRGISGSQYRDYRAVTRAASHIIPDITETRDSEIWDRILRSWMLANLLGDDDGLYGYKKEIRTRFSYFEDDKIYEYNNFSPGEGIYSYLKDKSFPGGGKSGPHIKYLGVSVGGIVAAPPYTGEILLTYNANPDPNGEDEIGYVLSYSGEENPSLAAARTAVPSAGPSSYPIGVHDLRALRAAEGAR